MIYMEVATSLFSRNCDLKVQKSPFTAETKQMCALFFLCSAGVFTVFCLKKKKNQLSFRVLADSLVAQGGAGRVGGERSLFAACIGRRLVYNTVQERFKKKKKKKLNLARNMVQERMSPWGAPMPGYRVPSLGSNRCPAEKLQALNLTVVSCVNEDS